MTTLLHLNQSIIDFQDSLAREQRFAQDACQNLLNGTRLLREALDALERDIRANFEERDRALARLIGNSQPYTTLIEGGGADAEDIPTPPPAKPVRKTETP